jgi:hypothetical protein
MDTAAILSELNKLAMDIQKSQCGQTADLESTQERKFIANETRQYRNTRHVLDRVVDSERNLHDAIERRGSENMSATLATSGEIKTLQENIGARAAVQGEKNMNEISGYFNDNAIRSTASHGRTLYEIKDVENDIGEYFNDTQKEIIGVGASIERQSAVEFAALQSGLLKVENSLGRQADSHFAVLQNQASANLGQIQIQALQLNKDLVKQMAECCCEIKETVGKSEGVITSLINSNETADLRSKLATAETQNLIASISGRR